MTVGDGESKFTRAGRKHTIVGGDTRDAASMVNTLFVISLSKLVFTEVLCASVLRLEWLEERKDQFNSLSKAVHALAKEYTQHT